MPLRRAIAIAISTLLIAILLWRVDTAALMTNFRATNWILFVAALVLFIPQILVIAVRWRLLVTPFAKLPLSESVRLVLAGASMNLLLPGKMGDLTKGWFLARAGHVSTRLGMGVVIFEKMLDVATLAAFMLAGVAMLVLGSIGSGGIDLTGNAIHPAGLLLAGGIGLAAVAGVSVLYFVPVEKIPGMSRLLNPGDPVHESGVTARVRRLIQGAQSTMATLRQRGARRGQVIILSFTIWVLHLTQIYLFFASVNALPTLSEFICMVPLAIFIGLIPISISGFGTRDAAFVMLLPGVAPGAILAASFYVNLRYILPALAGVPHLARYTVFTRDPKK